jgi:excisionase family DNA binding protein
LLTISEAAGQLGISEKSLRRLINAGEVISVHLGALHRVSQRALEDYIRRLEAGHGTR